MVRLASAFNNLTKEQAICLECLEFVYDINTIKTNRAIAIRIDCSENVNIEFLLDVLKDKGCFNIVLDNVKEEDIKEYKNAIEKKIKGSRISIIAKGDISHLIELASNNDISYIFDPNNFDDSLYAFKKLKKRISFINLHEKDNYGYETMCGTTPKSKELIKYIVKKNIDSIIIINSNMEEYLKLRNIYLKRSFIKKILPTRINKSMKVFNYMIDSKKELSLYEFNKLEINYLNMLIKK